MSRSDRLCAIRSVLPKLVGHTECQRQHLGVGLDERRRKWKFNRQRDWECFGERDRERRRILLGERKCGRNGWRLRRWF